MKFQEPEQALAYINEIATPLDSTKYTYDFYLPFEGDSPVLCCYDNGQLAMMKTKNGLIGYFQLTYTCFDEDIAEEFDLEFVIDAANL